MFCEATKGLWSKRKGMLWFITLVFQACFAMAAQEQVVLSEAEKAWVQAHPSVSWAADPEWPPFSKLGSNGQSRGISRELVELLAARTGLNLKFVGTSNWTEALTRTAAGDLDFIAGMARTEERKKIGLQFTETFCEFPSAIVTRRDEPFLTSVEQLRTKRIALARNYATTEELMKLYPDANVLITDNEEQSMLAVAGGKADATVLNIASASYVVHMRGLSNLKISGFSELDFFLCIGVRPGAPELVSILEKGLATINPREKERIYAHYILPETRGAIDWKVWRLRALYLALAGLLILGVMLAWNRQLAREVRRRKDAEASLLKAHGELAARASELDRRACDLEAANQKLSWANQDMESFASSVSHDLRAPARLLGTYAQLIEMEAGERLTPEIRRHFSAIQKQSQRMHDLIEALLVFARVGKDEMRFGPLNLEELAREVIKELEHESPGRRIAWEIKPMPKAWGDKGTIKQVLANLLGNAAKFTRNSPSASIQVGALPSNAGEKEVVFYVKDNGAGFESDKAGALFEPFKRLHRKEEFDGTGMGLASVKRIIHKHGGRVWAKGEASVGATFFFSLPSSPP